MLQVQHATENTTWTRSVNEKEDSYQRDVVQDEAEGGGSFCQVLADLPGHKLSLGDELTGVKASLRIDKQNTKITHTVELDSVLLPPLVS